MYDLQGLVRIDGIHTNWLHGISQDRFQELLHPPLLVEIVLLSIASGKPKLVDAVLFVI